MAEAILAHKAKEMSLDIEADSAGTAAYHIGSSPDYRTMNVLEEKGISYSHRGRQIAEKDFYYYDFILVMDESNLADVQSQELLDGIATIKMIRIYDKVQSGLAVPDPYYGDTEGFYEVYDLLEESIEGFLKQSVIA